jgi:beta-1,4-mannosyltransferase
MQSMTRLRVIAWPGFLFRHRNPYTWLLYTNLPASVEIRDFSIGLLLRRRFDLWHMHWPEYFLNRPRLSSVLPRLVVLIGLLHWARWRGTKLVWTIHNLQSHERYHPRIEQWFSRRLISRLDGVISLSSTALAAAMARYPALREVPAFVIPIGHYKGVYNDVISKESARRALDIPEPAHVVTFFGLIRPYKNVPALMRAFKGVADPNAVLVIVGSPSSAALGSAIRALAKDDPRIRLCLSFVSDEEVQTYMRATDLVALPFTEILNSSSAIMALSFDRPVLVPIMGSLGELRDTVGPEWVRLYSGTLTSEELSGALHWATQEGRSAGARLTALDWRVLGERTARAYRTIVDSAR